MTQSKSPSDFKAATGCVEANAEKFEAALKNGEAAQTVADTLAAEHFSAAER